MSILKLEVTAETKAQYLNRLMTTLKILPLGSGSFSKVFQHPFYSNVAVKLVLAKSVRYLEYLDWCLSHQSNPYVPQLVGPPIKAKLDRGVMYVVFLEKLSPLDDSTLLNRVFYFASLFMTPSQIGEYSRIFDYRMQAFDIPIGTTRQTGWEQLAKQTKDKYVAEIAGKLVVMGHLDLSGSNMMLRGKQLVFTDPVAG